MRNLNLTLEIKIIVNVDIKILLKSLTPWIKTTYTLDIEFLCTDVYIRPDNKTDVRIDPL